MPPRRWLILSSDAKKLKTRTRPPEESEPRSATEDEAESVGGLGAVEGEDAVEAQEAAPEVHEAAVESADEAEEVAAEVAAEEVVAADDSDAAEARSRRTSDSRF